MAIKEVCFDGEIKEIEETLDSMEIEELPFPSPFSLGSVENNPENFLALLVLPLFFSPCLLVEN
ncbi:hypothetical protein GOP47_0026792 [Adiantum capillus-veneris]|nr:hypothetical protein GOP47_0026792 [Adiantum capillus-veneris]